MIAGAKYSPERSILFAEPVIEILDLRAASAEKSPISRVNQQIARWQID
jgi:hypothetical protein